MKVCYCFLPLLLLAACQQMEPENTLPQNRPEGAGEKADSVWTLTIQASKGTVTKGLDLTNEGGTLNAYWRNTEKVRVYKADNYLGSLDVIPGAGEKPTTATLRGDITTATLAVDDELTLFIPRADWDYTGQDGTLATLQDKYDYAVATVTINSLTAGQASVSAEARFQNKQSVYRFSFKKSDESALSVKGMVISSGNNALVQKLDLGISGWTPTLGSLTVTPGSATSDPLYVSLRNSGTAADTYSFVITGSDDALYMATKAIPNTVLDVPGKFISAVGITAAQASFTPIDETTDTAL